MSHDSTLVHAAHCCARCGCKYGQPDCPVTTLKVPATYKCGECEETRRDLILQLRALSAEELAAVLSEIEP